MQNTEIKSLNITKCSDSIYTGVPDETEIEITRTPGAPNATFPSVGITQSQLVFWLNSDPTQAPHWPLFPSGLQPRTQTGFGNTSDNVQPAQGFVKFTPPAQGQKVTVTYTCKVPGHTGEQGQIDVYLDFFSNPNQLANGTVGVPYPATPLTTGGKPPFKITLADVSLPKGMSVSNDPVNGATLTGTPAQAGNNFAFTMHCEDDLKNAVDQTYLLTVNPGPVLPT